MIFLDSTKKWFSKHQNKAKLNNLDDSGVLSSDFSGLRISMASTTSTASVASMTSTASIHKRNYWVLCFHQPRHQTDLSWSLNVEWTIKNPLFYWFLAPFVLEAVEASLSYFFENWMMKVKYPKLRIIQIPSNTILQAYFYLSDPNYFWRFNMRYPVT